jgi:16S rRNA pseudouridine516 synthase
MERVSNKTIRLDRLLSQATELSRKQAGMEIRKKRVTLGGEVVRDPALRVAVDADVRWRDQPVVLPGRLYLVMNKPAGLVCARRDAVHSTVLDLLPPELARRVHIVGRLDRETTGLLLLTDDGEWSHRITSPRQGCAKQYLANLAEPLAADAEQRFAEGLRLRNEDRPTRPAQLQRLDEQTVRVILHEGRYHQVRRMFAALGNRVVRLHREAVGGLRLDPCLAPGQWRELSAGEKTMLACPPAAEGPRRFIRHPSAVPLSCQTTVGGQPSRERLRNIGHAGLCFESSRKLSPGARVHLTIPVLDQSFEVDAEVSWCRGLPSGQGYEVGVSFRDTDTGFTVRMVEQLCHIEAYRERVLREEGRALSSEAAAEEWIARYATDFPDGMDD